MPSPAWSAVIVQVPADWTKTILPVTEQTVAVNEENATGSDEDAVELIKKTDNPKSLAGKVLKVMV